MNPMLKAAREASGKTQSQVAKESGITARAYQNYERGDREPNVRVAFRIADALCGDPRELFGAATPRKV